MKEHIIVSMDKGVLKKLIEKAEAKNVSVSTFIESVMRETLPPRDTADSGEDEPRRPYQALDDFLKEVERSEIKRALMRSETKGLAAEFLGISFRSLRHRLKQLGLE